MSKKQNKQASLKLLEPAEIFTLAVGLISIFAVTSWIAFGFGARTETSDKATYLVSGIGGLLFLILSFSNQRKSGFKDSVSIIAWISIIVGILVIEHKDMAREHPMGFGPIVAILTAFLFPIVSRYLNGNLTLNHLSKKLINVYSVILIGLISIAFFQTRTTMTNAPHSEYVLNEIWAPATGNNPYQNFIPQYTFLIGWLVKPILTILGPIAGSEFLVLLMTFFAFLCTFLMVYLAKKAFPELPWVVVIIAALPFCTPSSGWNRISFVGPATTILSGPSLRIFGGIIVGSLTIWSLCRLINGKKYRLALTITGLASALIVWNNLDFGLAAMVAMFLVAGLLNFALKDIRKDSLLFLFLGWLAGNLFVFTFLSLQNGVPNWSYFGWFMRSFAGGFGSVTIEMPGPVNLDFPLIMGTAVFGAYFILTKYKNSTSNDSGAEKENLNLRSALTAAYFGAFSTFGLPYYINRSYHSGQMSILYFPLAIALIATIGLIWRTRKLNRTEFSSKFPALILAFMIATVAVFPSPTWEVKRLMGGNPDGSFPRLPVAQMAENAKKYSDLAKELGYSIAYFGEEGNYFELATGINSANIFNSPFDGFQNNNAVKLMCKTLGREGGDILIMTELTQQAFAWNDRSLCEGMYYLYKDSRFGTIGLRSPLKNL